MMIPSPDDVSSEATAVGDATRHARFVRLLVTHQRDVYTYVLSLVPNWADAEEIVQETFVRIWEQIDQWDQDRDFRAWACTIAYYQVSTFRKRMSRRKECFSEEFLEAVAAELDVASDALQQRCGALSRCLTKLDSAGQTLLNLIYSSELTAHEVAHELGCTVTVVYKRLSRIRQSLHQCIDRTIRGWEANG